jgi:hypothetical protein
MGPVWQSDAGRTESHKDARFRLEGIPYWDMSLTDGKYSQDVYDEETSLRKLFSRSSKQGTEKT